MSSLVLGTWFGFYKNCFSINFSVRWPHDNSFREYSDSFLSTYCRPNSCLISFLIFRTRLDGTYIWKFKSSMNSFYMLLILASYCQAQEQVLVESNKALTRKVIHHMCKTSLHCPLAAWISRSSFVCMLYMFPLFNFFFIWSLVKLIYVGSMSKILPMVSFFY